MCEICVAFRPYDPDCAYSGLFQEAAPSQGSSLAPPPMGTLEEMADYLTDGYWQKNGLSQHSFDTSTSNKITVDITGLPPEAQALARAAMQAWETVADIQFVEVNKHAQITFTDTQPGAYSSYSAIGNTTQSAIVNVSASWLANYGTDLDDYSFLTYLHELGHALGLGHQGAYNGSGNFSQNAVFGNDSYQMSVMSYFAQHENPLINASYARPLTAMSVDILAIQALYGAPGSNAATAGDTVYGRKQSLDGYLGDYFNFLTTGKDPKKMFGTGAVAMTIYDQGGIDTVDFRTDKTNQKVDLASEGVWDVFGLTGNVVVARDTVLENYIAGSGHDRVTGNDVDNRLDGKAGNDTLKGGAGDDELMGGRDDDLVNGDAGNDSLKGQSGHDQMFGGDGKDTLKGQAQDDSLWGGDGDDELNGGGSMDSLYGQNGRDMLIGAGGNDYLSGGTDEDTLRGGTGADTLEGGAQDDLLKGGDHADELFGGTGNDTLFGEDGNDILCGDSGNDLLKGGQGKDAFIFQASFGQDTIADFEDGLDSLHLDDALWGGGLSVQGVLDKYADSSGNTTVLDFGNGKVITLTGISNVQDLLDDIVIF